MKTCEFCGGESVWGAGAVQDGALHYSKIQCAEVLRGRLDATLRQLGDLRRDVYAWLGYWHDQMPAEAIKALEGNLAELPAVRRHLQYCDVNDLIIKGKPCNCGPYRAVNPDLDEQT